MYPLVTLKKGLLKDSSLINSASPNTIPGSDDQVKLTGLIKLNEELLAQNGALRNENTLLKGKLVDSNAAFGGFVEGIEDDSEAGVGFGHRRVPEDIRDAVERILNPVPGMVRYFLRARYSRVPTLHIHSLSYPNWQVHAREMELLKLIHWILLTFLSKK